MSDELLYTSAPKGLKAGSRGFCTVQATAGMPPATATLLESLSGYRHIAAPGDAANSIVWRHVIAALAGQRRHVLSRLADAGADYTGRSNKLVHHLALDAAELNTTGPAWSQLQAATHDSAWSGEPKVLRAGRSLPDAMIAPQPCNAWRRVTGDAGWGGFLAQRLLGGSSAPISILYPAQMAPLELIAETIALLPERHRWRVTYTTCHTNLPPGVECAWRFVPDGSPEALELRKRPDIERLDLTGRLGPAPDGPWVDAARTGKRPEAPAAPPPPVAAPISVGSRAGLEAALEVEGPADWHSDIAGSPPPPPRYRRCGGRKPSFNGKERSMSAWALALIATAVLMLMIGVPLAWFLTWGPGQHLVAQYRKDSSQKIKKQLPIPASAASQDDTSVQEQPRADKADAEQAKERAEQKKVEQKEADRVEAERKRQEEEERLRQQKATEEANEAKRLAEEALKQEQAAQPLFSSEVVYCELPSVLGEPATITLSNTSGAPDIDSVQFLVPSQWGANLEVIRSNSTSVLSKKPDIEGLGQKSTHILRVQLKNRAIVITPLATPTNLADLSRCAVEIKSKGSDASFRVLLERPKPLPMPAPASERQEYSNQEFLDWLNSSIEISGDSLPEIGLAPMVEASIAGKSQRGDLSKWTAEIGDALVLQCSRRVDSSGLSRVVLSLHAKEREKIRRFVRAESFWNNNEQRLLLVESATKDIEDGQRELKALEKSLSASPSAIESANGKVERGTVTKAAFDVSLASFCEYVLQNREKAAPAQVLAGGLNRIDPDRNKLGELDNAKYWQNLQRGAVLLKATREQREQLADEYSIVYPLRRHSEAFEVISAYATFATTREIPEASEAMPQ